MLMVAIVASTVLGAFGWRAGCLELPRGGKGKYQYVKFVNMVFPLPLYIFEKSDGTEGSSPLEFEYSVLYYKNRLRVSRDFL